MFSGRILLNFLGAVVSWPSLRILPSVSRGLTGPENREVCNSRSAIRCSLVRGSVKCGLVNLGRVRHGRVNQDLQVTGSVGHQAGQ